MTVPLDEEALAETLPPEHRAERGAFFTPRPIVDLALSRVATFLPAGQRVTVVDPACGAGAFLSAAAERWPRAALQGLELHEGSAERCRERVPRASVVVGDALVGDVLERALPAPGEAGFEVWVGNPPYNGTSPLLKDPAAWKAACAWLPEGFALPRGTSLREDFLFFLLRAAAHLGGRPGAVAFVTSATLLDAYQYAPVREALTSLLNLREVIDLGAGVFRGARVRTCITVWTSPGPTQGPVAFEERGESRAFRLARPDFRFRPEDEQAAQLDAAWRAQGEALTTLVPISCPGLKTRFDELLVDDDADRLLARVTEFLAVDAAGLGAFAERHGLPEKTGAKLAALHADGRGVTASRAQVRPFIRYRGPLAMGAPAFCYLERRLIPRGDHRLRGAWDPHAQPVKLVFNVHELPLAAHVLDAPGCVTAYRHSRFAPLLVPRKVRDGGIDAAGRLEGTDLTDLVPNLSPRGLAAADRLGSARAVFDAIARFVQSSAFQETWAPAYGASRTPCVPVDAWTDAATGRGQVEFPFARRD